MEKKEKAALLRKERKRSLLDPVADVVAKTDREPVEGVSADALDAVQTAERAYIIKKALDVRKAAEAAKLSTKQPAADPFIKPAFESKPKPAEIVKEKPVEPPKVVEQKKAEP